eukprot:2730670-Ditylum_brightwellii.AAC.1
MTGDIAQNAEKNKKKNLDVRIDEGSVTSDTDDDVILSSTSTSSAHQQRILARTRARNKISQTMTNLKNHHLKIPE